MGIIKNYQPLKNTCKVTFTYPVTPVSKVKSVQVLGDFNNWDAKKGPKMKASKTMFSTVIELKAGQKYEFRYLLDGATWDNDHNADSYVPSPFGGISNSVIVLDEMKSEKTAPSKTVKAVASKASVKAPAKVKTSAPKAVKPAAAKVAKPAVAKVAKPVAAKVSKPATAKVVKPAAVKVVKPAAAKVVKPAAAKVAKPAAAKVAKPAVAKVVKPAAAKVSKPAIVKVVKPAAAKVSKPAIVKVVEPATVKAVKKATPTTVKTVAPKKVTSNIVKIVKDDLTKIEGIGPKIAELLTAKGIISFADLAKSKLATLQSILTEAGSRFTMHDPTSWTKQSELAAKGSWGDLKKLQQELNGGKAVK